MVKVYMDSSRIFSQLPGRWLVVVERRAGGTTNLRCAEVADDDDDGGMEETEAISDRVEPIRTIFLSSKDLSWMLEEEEEEEDDDDDRSSAKKGGLSNPTFGLTMYFCFSTGMERVDATCSDKSLIVASY